jgi:UDP-glucuronate decarboxylase
MLGLAKRLKAKILQASTSEVYGDPTVHPQPETYLGSVNPIGPRACYDEGKRCAETLFFDYHRQHRIKIKVARIFNTYGPRMHPNDGRVVSNFVLQALRGEPITIYGEGSQTRSFCYVDDMVDGLIRLMESPDDFTPLESPAACSGDEPRKRPKVLRGEPPRGKVEDFLTGLTGPVNLGNPEEITILELTEKILKLTGSRSKILFKPLPPDDPQRRQPDITLAREKLGWAPKVSLEEGLLKTITYFSDLLKSGYEV